jgi:hypothetical protein
MDTKRQHAAEHSRDAKSATGLLGQKWILQDPTGPVDNSDIDLVGDPDDCMIDVATSILDEGLYSLMAAWSAADLTLQDSKEEFEGQYDRGNYELANERFRVARNILETYRNMEQVRAYMRTIRRRASTRADEWEKTLKGLGFDAREARAEHLRKSRMSNKEKMKALDEDLEKRSMNHAALDYLFNGRGKPPATE